MTTEDKYLNLNTHTSRTHCSKDYPVYLYTLSCSCKRLSLCLLRNLTQTKVHWGSTLKTTGKGKHLADNDITLFCTKMLKIENSAECVWLSCLSWLFTVSSPPIHSFYTSPHSQSFHIPDINPRSPQVSERVTLLVQQRIHTRPRGCRDLGL